jgi:hypothetical protein
MNRETKLLPALVLAVALPAVLAAVPQASHPDFSGRWSLDKSASHMPRLGDIESKDMTVEHKEPKIGIRVKALYSMGSGSSFLGAVTDGVERENEEDAAFKEEAEQAGQYAVGSSTGMKVKALWDGDRLAISTTISDTPDGSTIEKEQVWSLSPDGQTLTVEFTRRGGPDGEVKGTEVYRKKSDPSNRIPKERR